MKKKLSLIILFGILGVGVYGQTIKSLGYNTTNGQVVYSGTNTLTVTNGIEIDANGAMKLSVTPENISFYSGAAGENILTMPLDDVPIFSSSYYWNDPSIRAAFGFATNLNTLWTATNSSNARSAVGLGWSALTNTNAANFRTAIALGQTDSVTFSSATISNSITVATTLGSSLFINNTNISIKYGPEGSGFLRLFNGVETISLGADGKTEISGPLAFDQAADAAITRTNLGLGLSVLTNTNNANFLSDLGIGTNSSPSFSNVSVSNLLVTGNFTNLGTIYGFKTNVGPFEGIGNFFASNNTTVSNETLFRVGLAEQNDKSAQFGFRVARTNNGGEGFAVFSVFGYNALMMIGPSDRSRSNSITNTNAGIEADIWSISPTNKVMTLITTNTGAMQMHRPIGFNTNASAPANTTNVVGWIEMYVGTNSVRVPYYQ